MPLRVECDQGVGDLLWALELLLPHNNVELYVPVGRKDLPPVARRAEGILRAVPGVTGVHYVPVDHRPNFLRTKVPLAEVLPRLLAGERVGWSPNPYLNEGVPLEDLAVGGKVRWDLELPREPAPGLAPGSFTVLYVSGDTTPARTHGANVFAVETWADVVARAYAAAGLGAETPVVLVGAAYDLAVQQSLAALLHRHGLKTAQEVDLSLGRLMTLFDRCRGLLTYQSGLGVLADMAGARQVWVNFDWLKGMKDCWVRPAHRGDRFVYRYFDDPPEAVADSYAAQLLKYPT